MRGVLGHGFILGVLSAPAADFEGLVEAQRNRLALDTLDSGPERRSNAPYIVGVAADRVGAAVGVLVADLVAVRLGEAVAVAAGVAVLVGAAVGEETSTGKGVPLTGDGSMVGACVRTGVEVTSKLGGTVSR